MHRVPATKGIPRSAARSAPVAHPGYLPERWTPASSMPTARVHPGWLRAIRIGSVKDGKVTMFVPPHKADTADGAITPHIVETDCVAGHYMMS
jgi:hypothetical protein